MSLVRFLKRNEINDKKWNALISKAACSLPYAFTWYLDAVAENWGAVIYREYETVMPLVWLKRLGVKCIYQPNYCQQLGFFSSNNPEPRVALAFLNYAKQHFAYVDINFNPSVQPFALEFSMRPKKNLLLDLSRSYTETRKQYAENHKRNLAKAAKAGLEFSEDTALKQFQKFYIGNVNTQKEKFKPLHSKIFKSLSDLLLGNETGKIFVAKDTGGNLLAAVLLIFHHNRIIGIINTSSAGGKKHGASHFLFDQVIQKFSGQPYILDFEGSSIAGIARFYEGFGAQPETFYNYHYNIVKNAANWFN